MEADEGYWLSSKKWGAQKSFVSRSSTVPCSVSLLGSIWNAGEASCPLALPFSHRRNFRPRGSPQCSTELTLVGGCGQSENTPLTLLMLFFSDFVVERDASDSPLCSGIFRKESCLWIVASFPFPERDWTQEPHILPSIFLLVPVLLNHCFVRFIWVFSCFRLNGKSDLCYFVLARRHSIYLFAQWI